MRKLKTYPSNCLLGKGRKNKEGAGIAFSYGLGERVNISPMAFLLI